MKVSQMDSSPQPSSSLPRDTSNQNVVQRSRVGPNRGSRSVPEFREDLSHQYVTHGSAAVVGQQEGTNYNQEPDVTLEAL